MSAIEEPADTTAGITEPVQPTITPDMPADPPPRPVMVSRGATITDANGKPLTIEIQDEVIIIRTKHGQAFTADSALLGAVIAELDAAGARLR